MHLITSMPGLLSPITHPTMRHACAIAAAVCLVAASSAFMSLTGMDMSQPEQAELEMALHEEIIKNTLNAKLRVPNDTSSTNSDSADWTPSTPCAESECPLTSYNADSA